MASKPLAGRYDLGELLSATPMSRVHVATDRVLERQVVVKLLAANADHARFEREAHAAAGLAHPNIVQLFDYGQEDGAAYMVLEYLPGGTLADHLEPGRPLPDDDVARIAGDVAAGLEYAHRNGIVHRDLKPANILFDAEARAKIGDLGIASIDADTTLTEAGTVLGTAGYISPEQAAGDVVTPASDVYAFGVTLFQMLTGRLPFESGSSVEIAAAKQLNDAPSIRSLRPDAPEALASLATASLARRPEDRPLDGAALVAALADSSSVSPPVPIPEAATVVVGRGRARSSPRVVKPLATALVLALLVGAGVVIAGLVTRGHSAQAPALTDGTTNGRAATAGTRAGASTAAPQTSSTTKPTTSRSTRPAPAASVTTTPATVTTDVTVTTPATSTDVTTSDTTTAP